MEITLKFLSPAFLYGTDKTKPEFRIPSLIGQMRYWWRMTQDWSSGNFEQFKEKEGEIFGIVDERGAEAKPFYVYLAKKPEIRQCPSVNPVMQRGQPVSGLFSFPSRGNGVAYFFYPFMRHEGQFKWIPERSEVKLIFEFKPGADRQHLILSLFLLGRFGGLGGRSRRGAGAIELTGDDLFNLTEKHLAKYVASKPEAREYLPYHEFFNHIHQNSPLWSALKNTARVKKSHPPQNGWDSALNAVGSIMQNFRTTQRICDGNTGRVDPDFIQEAIDLHRHFADSAHNAPPNPITKDAFGLPRIINFTSCQPPARNALTINAYKRNGNDFEESRRASPLHITVNRSGNQYYCTLIALWDGIGFLPFNQDVRVKYRQNNNPSRFPVVGNPPVDKLEAFLKLSPLTNL